MSRQLCSWIGYFRRPDTVRRQLLATNFATVVDLNLIDVMCTALCGAFAIALLCEVGGDVRARF